MSCFVIRGGVPLSGSVGIAGSKNASLPILFSTLITRGISCIVGLPHISDVSDTLDILSCFGAEIWTLGDKTYIDTSNIEYVLPPSSLTRRLRASTYLIGACLGGFRRACISPFGGCAFDVRPIDLHLFAVSSFGGQISGDLIHGESLCGADILFPKKSVGATVNALIIAASIKGKSRIFKYAKEPHVFCLIDYLRSCGADITYNEEYVEIDGGELHGGCISLIPDMIEAGSFLSLSMLFSGSVSVAFPQADQLSSYISAFTLGGSDFINRDSCISATLPRSPVGIITGDYPAFPTDLQPVCAPVLAASLGGDITDTVWKGRFGYLSALSELGVRYELSGNRARIFPSRLKSGRAVAPDLRGGFSLVLAALCANGESIIENCELIFRGYEGLLKKLRSLGANIYQK